MQYLTGGIHRGVASGSFSRYDWHVFKLEGDDIDAAGKLRNRIQVCVVRLNLDISHLAGRGVIIRRKYMDTVTHLPCSNGKHPA